MTTTVVLPKSERLINGTKQRNSILEAYETLYGNTSTGRSVTATNKGEPSSSTLPIHPPGQFVFAKQPTMRADSNHAYRVGDLTINNVLLPVMKYLSNEDMNKLRQLSKQLKQFVPEIIRLARIDFSDLSQPRLNYSLQQEVDKHRVDMAGAAMVYYNGDPGMVTRFINEEYRGAWRDINKTLTAVEPHVSSDDYEHIKRVLTEGTPAKVNFWESTASKLEVMGFGNQQSYTSNPQIARELLNKEDKHSHLLPMNEMFCHLSPFLRQNSQGIVVKAGSDPRQVWDSSTQITPMMTVLNQVIDTDDEADITFGLVEPSFLAHIYNLRARYPGREIYIAMADVKACFRWILFNRWHILSSNIDGIRVEYISDQLGAVSTSNRVTVKNLCEE